MQIIEHMPPPTQPLPLGPLDDLLNHPTRDDRRVDLEGQVVIRYSDREDPVTERTQNVSATGMFIRTRALQPPGSRCSFELDLANGLEPIAGQGEVIWVRPQDDGLFRPTGMGVRFVDLDPESRKLMRWSVEHRTRELRKFLRLDVVEAPPTEQRTMSDLEDLRSELEDALAESAEPSVLAELRADVDLALQEVLESSRGCGGAQSSGVLLADDELRRLHPYAGCASSTGPATRARHRGWRIVSAIPLIPLAALALYLLSPASEPAAATTPVADMVADAPVPEMVAADVAAQPEEPPPASIAAPAVAGSEIEPAALESEVEELTLAWAEAWSQQRVRTYLAFYASAFRPPGALSRAEWEVQRQERILKPRSVRVEVRDLETELVSAERARVRFAQTYRSDRFQDQVRKTLELVRGEQGWQILEERVGA